MYGLKEALLLNLFSQFLSMKLATVNPELNIDIDRILAKDVRRSESLPKIHNEISNKTNKAAFSPFRLCNQEM